ncbi:MAG TPA: hypothetical protein VHB69_15125 [Mycobacteriales bacterium]|nr:hypothetical protein [Mycobacteriales bacterium]
MTFGPYDEPPPDPSGDVLLALPPIAVALPLAWDRHLRKRLRHPYQRWLEAVLSDPPADWPTVRSFWERHHYDVLVARWADAVGERLVVTVAAAPSEAGRALSASEAEVVRRINLAFHHRKWPVQRYDQVVRRAVLPALLSRPAAPAVPVATPDWAITRANQIAAADVAKLQASGVRIDGELAALSTVRVSESAPPDDFAPLALDAAADAVVAAIDAVAATWSR